MAEKLVVESMDADAKVVGFSREASIAASLNLFDQHGEPAQHAQHAHVEPVEPEHIERVQHTSQAHAQHASQVLAQAHAQHASQVLAPVVLEEQVPPAGYRSRRAFWTDWRQQFDEGFRWPTHRESAVEQVRETYMHILLSPLAPPASDGTHHLLQTFLALYTLLLFFSFVSFSFWRMRVVTFATLIVHMYLVIERQLWQF